MAEEKQVQAVTPGRVGLAEALKRHHVVTVQGMVEDPKDFLKPEFWALVAKDFTVGDTVEVRDDAMSYWGEFLVLSCAPTWAKIELLREKKLIAQKDLEEISNEFRVEFKGPHLKYCIIRDSDNEIVHKGEQTKLAANDWLQQYLRALKRAA